MWLFLMQALCTGISLATLLFLLWATREYIRARKHINNIIRGLYAPLRQLGPKMEMDDLIDELLDEEINTAPRKPAEKRLEPAAPAAVKQPECANSVSETQRERLATIVAGGQSKQYLGKELCVEEIESLNDEEINKLYARYEAKLGAAMTKTLGRAILQLYTTAASRFLPIPPENRPLLIDDLESDPFVNHALNSSACELYYRYGKFLAPVTAVLTTIKYCQFGHQCPITYEDDGGEQGDDKCGATSPGAWEGRGAKGGGPQGCAC